MILTFKSTILFPTIALQRQIRGQGQLYNTVSGSDCLFHLPATCFLLQSLELGPSIRWVVSLLTTPPAATNKSVDVWPVSSNVNIVQQMFS